MLEAPAGRWVTVAGHRLFLDERGDPAAPPVLVVHGGPGEGCWDFMSVQGDRLARTLRVVGVDQRGCLRSDPLPAGETLTLDDLVADLNGLREALGISTWALLGHSYGGNLALRYATTHPDRVSAVVFENPTWDEAAFTGHLLTRLLALLEQVGDANTADRCRRLLTIPEESGVAGFWRRQALLDSLAAARQDLYLHNRDAHAAMTARYEATTLADALFERGMEHGQALLDSPDFFTSLRPRVTRLACPSLLIRGAYDPVTSDVEVRTYAALPGARVVVADRSAHFVHSEQPDLYEQLVIDLVAATSSTPAR